MTTVKIHPPPTRDRPCTSPLPTLLQTPSGLAILELQGTINLPQDAEGRDVSGVEVGRVEFPDYDPSTAEGGGTGWMKTVQLYIGQHQRLTGEVKKLPRALAVVRRRGAVGEQEHYPEEGSGAEGGDLEVIEIVKYKLMFSHRPEPVGTTHAPS